MGEQVHRFTALRASYMQKGLVLGGPSQVLTHLNYDGTTYAVTIEQGVVRTITIRTEQPISWNKFVVPLSIIEKLLMLCDGAFVRLNEVRYFGSSENDDGAAESGRVLAMRLNYYVTDKRFTIYDKLVEYQDYINGIVLEKWQKLLGELDIAIRCIFIS